MGDEKTTREILEERLSKGGTPLYNPAALKETAENFEKWSGMELLTIWMQDFEFKFV